MAADLAAARGRGCASSAAATRTSANFGVFASPERRLVFDLNDFDETLPGAVGVGCQAARREPARRRAGQRVSRARSAARGARLRRELPQRHGELRGHGHPRRVVCAASRSRRCSTSTPRSSSRELVKRTQKALAKARTKDSLQALAQAHRGRRRRAADRRPTPADRARRRARQGRAARPDHRGPAPHPRAATVVTLPAERRVLFDQFELVDFARKVVGVGSVGTRGLDRPVARPRRRRPAVPADQGGAALGARAVRGAERVRQPRRARRRRAAADAGLERHLPRLAARRRSTARRDFYVRQLKDWKASADVERMVPDGPGGLRPAVRLDARPRPRAHRRPRRRSPPTSAAATVRPGDRSTFAEAYAEQNERDYAALAAARARRAGSRRATTSDATATAGCSPALTAPSGGRGERARTAPRWRAPPAPASASLPTTSFAVRLA